MPIIYLGNIEGISLKDLLIVGLVLYLICKFIINPFFRRI